MPGIAQNGQKHLIFIVVPQVRMKIREKGKQENKKIIIKQQQQQHEIE